jgi:hypothetical protein
MTKRSCGCSDKNCPHHRPLRGNPPPMPGNAADVLYDRKRGKSKRGRWWLFGR